MHCIEIYKQFTNGMILVTVTRNLFGYMYLHSFDKKYLDQISNPPATCGVYVKLSYVKEMILSLPEDCHGRHDLRK